MARQKGGWHRSARSLGAAGICLGVASLLATGALGTEGTTLRFVVRHETSQDSPTAEAERPLAASAISTDQALPGTRQAAPRGRGPVVRVASIRSVRAQSIARFDDAVVEPQVEQPPPVEEFVPPDVSSAHGPLQFPADACCPGRSRDKRYLWAGYPPAPPLGPQPRVPCLFGYLFGPAGHPCADEGPPACRRRSCGCRGVHTVPQDPAPRRHATPDAGPAPDPRGEWEPPVPPGAGQEPELPLPPNPLPEDARLEPIDRDRSAAVRRRSTQPTALTRPQAGSSGNVSVALVRVVSR